MRLAERREQHRARGGRSVGQEATEPGGERLAERMLMPIDNSPRAHRSPTVMASPWASSHHESARTEQLGRRAQLLIHAGEIVRGQRLEDAVLARGVLRGPLWGAAEERP